jgi:hypothetical protein
VIFTVGFVMRPLCDHRPCADRRAIGLVAPVLNVAAWLLQGFAQGGKFWAATTTLLEMG